MRSLRYPVWIWLAVFLLSACSPDKPQDAANESQKFYFLESLVLVENAGRQLQKPANKADKVKQALTAMDEGIKLAFHVESEFLDQFDPRLSKNYQRYFLKGVESYRLGIEAGDADEQKHGLRLLSQWAVFWAEASKDITAKMQNQ